MKDHPGGFLIQSLLS